MREFHANRGAKRALLDFGLNKIAAEPEFGTAMHENIISSTGDEGRARHRTSEAPGGQVSAGFMEHDRHMLRDPHNDAFTVPVGAMQSKAAAAYKLQGRRKFRNLHISIENRKGSVRKWTDAETGNEGRTKMKYPYGYIRRTKGMDGDHVDCYIGPNEEAKNVYVITTNKEMPDFKEEDEQKCMLGFNSAEEAKKVFLDHYDDPRFFRDMTIMSYPDFEKQVLKTMHGSMKKLGANIEEDDYRHTNTGPTHNKVPGDHLGLPQSSLVGMRSIKSDGMEPEDKIDRMFRFHDEPTSTRVLDGDTAALPESPGV